LAQLSEYEGTFDEYNEMVLQFGYITLFATAFPLAPLFALLNNLVEIRTDALKFLTYTRRPEYHGAANIGLRSLSYCEYNKSNYFDYSIGLWQKIIVVISVFAVVTNTVLIGFSADVVEKVLHNDIDHIVIVVVLLEVRYQHHFNNAPQEMIDL